VPQTPRHPEVNEQSPPRFEPNNQILAAPFERRNSFAFELGGDGVWLEGPHESRIADLDAVEPPPDQVRLQLLPDRLYLWQLGHA
jgi:hypothetical protein